MSMRLLPIALLAFALAPLVTVLAGEEYHDSIGLLRWLILAEVFMGVALLDSRLIMGLGKLRVVGAAGIALLVLSLPTYYLLISQYGARGAAWASIGLYGVYAAALYLARRALEGQGNRAGGPLRRKDNRRAYAGRHRL